MSRTAKRQDYVTGCKRPAAVVRGSSASGCRTTRDTSSQLISATSKKDGACVDDSAVMGPVAEFWRLGVHQRTRVMPAVQGARAR